MRLGAPVLRLKLRQLKEWHPTSSEQIQHWPSAKKVKPSKIFQKCSILRMWNIQKINRTSLKHVKARFLSKISQEQLSLSLLLSASVPQFFGSSRKLITFHDLLWKFLFGLAITCSAKKGRSCGRHGGMLSQRSHPHRWSMRCRHRGTLCSPKSSRHSRRAWSHDYRESVVETFNQSTLYCICARTCNPFLKV